MVIGCCAAHDRKKYSDMIAREKEIIRLISDLPDSHAKKWLECISICSINRKRKFLVSKYAPECFQKKLIKWLGLRRSSLEKRLMRHILANLTSEGRVQIKDIIVPFPADNSDVMYFIYALRDILLPYLLEGYENREGIISHLTLEGPYEYGSVMINKGDIVIDAGACIGEFSALASIRGAQKIYAFEPTPDIISNYLSKTSQYNKNIELLIYALSDRSGELSFYTGRTGSSSAVIPAQGNTSTIKVNAITLDDFVHQNRISRIDFIKADIEGAERYMLKGAEKVLKEFGPKLAICKYHLPDDPQVLRELILAANPRYIIEERWQKIFAYVPDA